MDKHPGDGDIVFAANGAGKTWLANRFPDRFVDTDEVLEELFGDFGDHAWDTFTRTKEGKKKLKDYLQARLEEGKSLLTNIDVRFFGWDADFMFAYEPSTYIEHIKENGRSDLIECFGESEMLMRARRFKSMGAILLPKGKFLADAIIT